MADDTGSIDVAGILQGLAGNNSMIGAVIDTVRQGAATNQKLTDARIDLQKQQAQDAQTIAQAKLDAEQKAQNNTINFATAEGVNMNSPSEIMTGLASQLKDHYMVQTGIASQIADNYASAGGNPFKRIAATFKNGVLTKQLNNEKQATQSTQDAISGLTNALQQTAVAQKTIMPVITDASKAAAVRSAGAQFNDQALQLEADGVKNNTASQLQVLTLNQQQMQNKIQGFQVQEAAVQREFTRQNIQLQREARQEALNNKEQAEQAKKDMVETTRLGIAKLYGAKGLDSVSKLPPDKIITMVTQGGKPGADPNLKMLSDAYSLGLGAQITGAFNLGASPADSAETVITSRVPIATPESKPVADMLINEYSAASAGKNRAMGYAVDPQFDKKTAGAVKTLANSNILAAAAEYQRNIKSNDLSNPYQAPSLDSIGKIQAIATDPFYLKVLKPLVDNGMTQTDPQKIVDLGTNAIKDGTVDFATARRGISLLFKGAVKLNNQQKQYDYYNVPVQTAYPTGIKAGNRPTAKVVDMTDPTQIANLITQSLTAAQYNTLFPEAR